MVAQQQEAIVGENSGVVIIGQENKNNMMMIKGKRTKRPRPLSPLALTMSTTTTTDEGGSATSEEWTAPNSVATSEEEHDMAHCLILLAQGTNNNNSHSSNTTATAANNNNNKGSLGISSSYECKTCNKSFASFQALGGHRASHKKPKLSTFASLSDLKKSPSSVIFSLINHDNHHHHHDDGTTLSLQMSNSPPLCTTTNNTNKTKVHECGICGAEFSSGQALGGHMRRHRPIGMSTTTTSTASPTENNNVTLVNSISIKDVKTSRNLLSLDLNLPAPEDEHHQLLQQRDSKFVFSSNEKTLVFAAASSQLVDCHY